MKKQNALILHPRDWAVSKYSEGAKLKYHHVYIGAPVPKKRWGEVTYDGYADIVTNEGKRQYKEMIKTLKPRIMLFWMHASFPTALLEYTRSTSPNTIICHWYSNHRYQMPKGVERVKDFLDVLVFNNKEPSQFNMYSKITNAKGKVPVLGTLYDGFNPDDIDYGKIKKTEYDCFFGGGTYLKKSMTDERFRFPGSKLRYDFLYEVAKKFKLNLHSEQKEAWNFVKVSREVFHPKYTYEMRKAKVNLNVNHFPAFYKAYTRRTIRSIFSRRAHVTLYIPGMEDDFENGKHLFWFKSVEEGIEQIDRLLKDDNLRNGMAEAAFKLACEKHTFEVRLKEFEMLLMDNGLI